MKLNDALRITKPRTITIEEVLKLKRATWEGGSDAGNYQIIGWNRALDTVIKLIEKP